MKALLHFFYPPICLHCGAKSSTSLLCPICFDTLTVVSSKGRCPRCFSLREGPMCMHCRQKPSHFHRQTALFDSFDGATEALFSFKTFDPKLIASHLIWKMAEENFPSRLTFQAPSPLSEVAAAMQKLWGKRQKSNEGICFLSATLRAPMLPQLKDFSRTLYHIAFAIE